VDATKKIGIGMVVATGAAVVAGLVASRRSRSRGAGLGGTWSDSVEKLVSPTGKVTKDKGVILSWALPPGPPPGRQSEARSDLRQICRKAGGKKALYKLRQEPWEEQAARLGLPERIIEQYGTAGREKLAKIYPGKSHKVNAEIQKQRTAAVAKYLGISEEEAERRMPTGLDRLHDRIGEWWENGTCPGCSEQCSRSCYVAKTASSYFGSQRQMWGNICDLVEGKGLPEIREDFCEGITRSRGEDRPCGVKAAVKLVKRTDDPNSRDAVVDSRRLDAIYLRVHVSGDFFDKDYAKAWLDHAKKSVEWYKREYAKWQRGERKNPPVRVYYWAYTRSWRVGMKSNHQKPDPQLLDVLRTLPTIEYPEERWPDWAAAEAAQDKQHADKPGKLPGDVRRGAKQAFAVLLSADSSTGIPWVKDKHNRIMPVSFVLTESDLTTLDEQGMPMVHEWDRKIPGIILRDHSLRKLSKAPEGSWEQGKVKFVCPMEDPAKLLEEKEKIGGCYNCRLCLPDHSQKVADVAFQRHLRGWPTGESFALWETAKRGNDLDWYDEWKKRGPIFALAVKPVATTFKKLTPSNRFRIRLWQERKLQRLPLVGE
jgi:hypothetical protein